MDSTKIGKMIKDIRLKNHLTQKEFAEKYKVTYQAVSKWETGKNLPDISLLGDICSDFHIDFSELIGEEKKKKKKTWYWILISIIIIIGIVLFFLLKEMNSFEFKTISTSCKDFEVSGSIAYDSKHSSIYISRVDYCGVEDSTIYKRIECFLYTKNNTIREEINKEELNQGNITLEEYLKTLSIQIDSYENTCKNYKENNLYLEIKAYKEDDTMKHFEIPLTMDTNCKK